MAIDYGLTNNTGGGQSRYLTVPVHADFDLAGNNNSVLKLVFVRDSANSQYMVSSGAFQAAHAYHSRISSVSASQNGFESYVGPAVTQWGGGDVAAGKWWWMAESIIAGSLAVMAAEYVGDPNTAYNGISNETATPVSMTNVARTLDNEINIGRLSTGAADRSFLGAIQKLVWVKGHGVTLAELEALANGNLPSAASYASSIVANFNFTDSAAATYTDSVGGHVATKFGTGWTDIASPYPAPSVTKGFTVILTDIDKAALAGQGNVDAIFYDVADPEDITLTAVPKKVSLKSNLANNGAYTMNVDAETALNIGQHGYVVCSVKHPTDHKLSLRFQSRVTIVDIS